MEGLSNEALEAFQTLAGGTTDIECTIKSVNKSNLTCVCEPVDTTNIAFNDVRLVAKKGADTFLIPSIGSNVIIRKLSNSVAYVALFSDIESIQLNGDNYGGVPISDEIINAILTIKDAIVNGVPAAGSSDGGTAYKASMTSLLSGINEQTLQSIKNKDVTHGGN